MADFNGALANAPYGSEVVPFPDPEWRAWCWQVRGCAVNFQNRVLFLSREKRGRGRNRKGLLYAAWGIFSEMIFETPGRSIVTP